MAPSVRARHRGRRRQHVNGKRRQLRFRCVGPSASESKRVESGEGNGGKLARAERHRVSYPPETGRAPRLGDENAASTARSRARSRARQLSRAACRWKTVSGIRNRLGEAPLRFSNKSFRKSRIHASLPLNVNALLIGWRKRASKDFYAQGQRNGLKRLISDKGIQGNPSSFCSSDARLIVRLA